MPVKSACLVAHIGLLEHLTNLLQKCYCDFTASFNSQLILQLPFIWIIIIIIIIIIKQENDYSDVRQL